MSKQKPAKKKVVVTTSSSASKRPAQPKTRAKAKTGTAAKRDLTFGRDTFLWMGIGFGLIVLGMILMTGGKMPSTDEWDPNLIYGFRRTVLAPFVILAGLGVEIYAIFKK